MQTFLPVEDYFESGVILDPNRQGKQVIEARQILNVLYKLKNMIPVKGWKNHPAVLMWKGYEYSLAEYATCVHIAFKERAKKPHKAYLNGADLFDWALKQKTGDPPWLGNEKIHSSHRGRLLHKGTLDQLKKWVLKQWILDTFGKKIRDCDIEDVKQACYFHGIHYNKLLKDSHYYQFQWEEMPSDIYVWPKI